MTSDDIEHVHNLKVLVAIARKIEPKRKVREIRIRAERNANKLLTKMWRESGVR